MRQVCIVGPVDKRGIVYPFLKVADIIGKCLVVTDDANFRRMATNYDNNFMLGRCEVIITNDISMTIVSDISLREKSYDFIIFITTNMIVESSDLIVYCHGRNLAVLEEDGLVDLVGKEYKEVLISGVKPVSKDASYLNIGGKLWQYVWDCEENKTLTPCKVSELAELSAYLFAPTVEVAKSEYLKILLRVE